MSKLDPEIHAEKFDPTTGGYLVKWEKYIALKEAADELAEALEWSEDELASYAPDPACRSKITDDVLRRVRETLARYREASQ